MLLWLTRYAFQLTQFVVKRTIARRWGCGRGRWRGRETKEGRAVKSQPSERRVRRAPWENWTRGAFCGSYRTPIHNAVTGGSSSLSSPLLRSIQVFDMTFPTRSATLNWFGSQPTKTAQSKHKSTYIYIYCIKKIYNYTMYICLIIVLKK